VVVQKTDTHRSERLTARGGTSEYYIGIVILVYTEETLKRSLIAKTTRQLESVVRSGIGIMITIKLLTLYVQLLNSEWLDVFSASNEGQQMTQRCPARLSTNAFGNGLTQHT
jgi:hypothetical protein